MGEFPLMYERPGADGPVEFWEHLYHQGVRLFHVDATCSEDIYNPVLRAWIEPGQFDFTPQAQRWQRLLDRCPEAQLCLRLYVASPPWWDAAHPQELQGFREPGSAVVTYEHDYRHTTRRTLPSIVSPVWRADAAVALARLLEWLESSGWAERVWGLVIGYGTTWEWGLLGSEGFLDYSVPMQQFFRDWLNRHYESVARLQEAWAQPAVDFQTAAIPAPEARLAGDQRGLRQFPRDRPAYDFQRCLSAANAGCLLHLAAILRRHPRPWKLGAMYGYTLTAREHNAMVGTMGPGGLQGGHHALAEVLQSGLLDFVGSPHIYADRSLEGGFLRPHVPVWSARQHGLVTYVEHDLWTFTNVPVTGAFPFSLGATTTRESSILHQRLTLAEALCRGGSYWWTDLTNSLHWGREVSNFSDEVLQEDLGSQVRWFEVLTRRGHHAGRAQIALVVHEAAVDALSLGSDLFMREVYDQLAAWSWCGAPFDVWLATDVTAETMQPYRLVYVFAPFVEPGLRDQLRGALAREGRTVWWGPYSGCLTNQGFETAAFTRLTALEPSEPVPQGGPMRVPLPAHTALYGSCYGLDAAALERIAADAGVHLYGSAPLQVMVGEGMVAVHVREAGDYQLHLPPGTWQDIFSDESFAAGDLIPMEALGVRLLVRDPDAGTR